MDSNRTNTTNVTALLNGSTIEGPNWTFTPSFTLFIQLSAFVNNGAMVVVFARNAALITPFTVYLFNLFASNFIVSIFFYSIELINELYSAWWLGYAMCTMFQYTSWVLTGSMCIAHGTIALNRLWAVSFPVSYRRYHKKRFAVAVIATLWISLHIIVIPGLVLDAVWYRPPMETNGCNINTDAPQAWLWFAQLVIMDTPVVIVVAVYPIICYKTIQRNRARVRPAGATGTKMASRRQRAPSTVSPSVRSDLEASVSVRAGGEKQIEHRMLCCRLPGVRRGNGHGFLALTLMTSTVLLCYSPASVYFTLYICFNIDVPGMFSKVMILYELAAVLDPIWFMLSLSSLRAAFRRTFIPCH
ncbi:hypothetical protein RvY_18320 [Ramazzottius varieornatus]|uniref:G-protein coupled receptors family 1 profile domain-containing protein n=1 Tax=Ramazzottius varieornatus TaxID=947166 RepID=A0A1D1W8N0_RAMVA|nr:hypothetical protein RvY_18320 [Ramazzottius varieornatus]